jgi:hypothetical protein
MRKLSSTFLQCLKSGFLSPITEQVKCDHDLSLDIREGYINIYYKGNSLLKLVEINPPCDVRLKFIRRYWKGWMFFLTAQKRLFLNLSKPSRALNKMSTDTLAISKKPTSKKRNRSGQLIKV